MKKILLLFSIFIVNLTFAQGDNCYEAMEITDPGNFCFTQNFTNNGSTQMMTSSGTTTVPLANATCWSLSNNNYDVWFKFTAVATTIKITVDGAKAPGSDWIYQPGISLLKGTCTGSATSYSSSFVPVACSFGNMFETTLTSNSIEKGETYFIRVASKSVSRGDFQMCLLNTDPVPTGSDDCTGAIKLCNEKTTHSIASLTSAGLLQETSNLILNGVKMTESQSIWYQFIAGNAGELTFNIKPKSAANDIDFGLYESATDNACGTKTPLRINIASCWVDADNGSTGLKSTETDIVENFGCSGTSNAFSKSVVLVPGKTYVLVINNASDDASAGFDLSFGGTATFSPDSLFTINPNDNNICVGDVVNLLPSTNVNNFTYSWLLDNNGTPQSVTGATTQTQTFSTPGIFNEKLTVTNSWNCSNSFTKKIYVVNKPVVTLTPSTATLCAPNTQVLTANPITSSGTISNAAGTGTVSNNINQITWSTTNLTNTSNTGLNSQSGSATATASTSNTHSITVTDDAGCSTTASSTVTVTTTNLPSVSGTTTICKDNSTSLTASTISTGTPVTFKWYDGNGTSANLLHTGVTYNTPTLPNTTTSSITVSYWVSETINGCESNRKEVIITVNPCICTPPTISTQPLPKIICGGTNTTTFSIVATGAGTTYQWQVSTDNGSTWTNIANTGVYTGATSDELTITNATTAMNNYKYKCIATNSCSSTSNDALLTVNPGITISGTKNGSACVSTTLPDIVLTTTSATGLGATTNNFGLPIGLNASFSGSATGGTVTISGTVPNAATSINYTIPLIETTGNCPTSITGTISVVTQNTVTSLTIAPLCINTALANNLKHTTSGATGIGTPTGLPTGVTASWLNNEITISGTPSVSGPFNYTIPLTGGCGTVNATGTITVNPDKIAGTASSSPTLCINTSLSPVITHTTTNSTGISTTSNNYGLPAGITATWATNTINISGTPTASGTFNYTIPLEGCGSANATGTINVNPLNTTSGPGTATTCINISITNITHSTTRATGIGTATGLPSGVTASWLNDQITISGTPSVSGPFNYTIPLTGGCGNVNATGTITVNPDKTAGAASSSPTLCINTSLSPVITHSTTNSTGLGATTNNYGLPAGVTASFASNTITINGSPSVSGAFSYTIPLLGCGSASATGTINVTPLNTTTGPGSRTTCINTAITDITHTTTGATGIGTATGLPTGVSASWLNNQITITGTPTTSTGSPFSYNIPLIGGCGTVNSTGTITVNPISTGILSSATGTDAQNVCVNSALTTITYATTGVTAIGSPTNLPNGVTAQFTGTITSGNIRITGAPTTDGVSNYIIPLIAGCGTPDVRGTITTNPLPIAIPTSNSPCEQDELTLDAGFTGATSYNWVGPNGFTSSIEKPKISTVTLNAKGKYTVTVTDNKSCSKSSDIQVNINPIDNIQFTDLTATCKNGTVFNLPTVNIPGGTWSSDDNVSIQNPYTGVFDPSKSMPDQTYKVVVTYSTKTISPARLCPATLSKVIYVYPTPDTSFIVKEKILCITDTLFAEVVNPTTGTIYTWDFKNGYTLDGNSIEYKYPKSGIYDLALTAKQGICTNTSLRKQHIKVVNIPENVEFTQSDTKIDFYNPEIQFKTNTNASYYLWNFGDGTTSTYKNPNHKFPEIPGEYIIDLTVSNMLNKCGITVSRSIFLPEPVIYFIPNTFTPNGDEINNTFQPIFTYGYDPQNYSFYIYNRWGALIFESHDSKIGWDGTFGNELLQNDTYVWKLEFKEKLEETKHVKTGHVTLLN